MKVQRTRKWSKEKQEEKDWQQAVASCVLLDKHFHEEIELNRTQMAVLSRYIDVQSKKSFYFFAKFVLGFDLLTDETHKVWCDKHQDSFNKRIEKIMRLKPRATFKTTVYGVAFILWLWACVATELRIFYTSNNATLLEEVSDSISQYLNPDIKSIFQTVFGKSHAAG